MSNESNYDFSDVDELVSRAEHLFNRLHQIPRMDVEEVYELTRHYFSEEVRLLNFQRQRQWMVEKGFN